MKKYSLHTYLLCLLINLCCSSCVDEIIPRGEQFPVEDGDGMMLLSPPEFTISLTRAQQQEVIQDSITDQGVLVKITKRPWVGMDLDTKNGIGTRSTWDDVVWEKDYSDIGVFTIESMNVDDYLSSDKSPASAEQYIKCFPFRRVITDGTDYGPEGVYRQPSGNSHAHNPDDYRNANFKVDARIERNSTRFFDNSEGKELNFYGYFPYQHQTAGINFTLPATSICRILQANHHTDNLLAMPYTFAATQNKDNINQHDLMYSVSEDAIDADTGVDIRLDKGHVRNKYGNRYKKRHAPNENDNVHMRFVHSFCRLQINISPGNYRDGQTAPIKLSKLYLTGEKVFVDGNLNLIEGIVSPKTAATIYRALDNSQADTDADGAYVDLRKHNLSIPMIVQPTGEIENSRDFKIVCVIDGVEYTCSLSSGVELVKNHVYDINLVLDPETKILVTSGGGATIAGYLPDGFDESTGLPTSAPAYILNEGADNVPFTSAGWLVMNPYTDWRVFKILKNGVPIDLNDTDLVKPYTGAGAATGAKYLRIGYTEGEVRNYTVVCIPVDWYRDPEDLTTHLDGKLNTGFRRENTPGFRNELVSYWKDISYNGNDGVLYNFETAASAYAMGDGDVDVLIGERSGWDGKGLRCDGKDDRVGFPGKINSSAYTISVYACIERDQPSTFPRIVSSGENSTDKFPGLVMQSETTIGRLRIYGHGVDALWGGGTNDAPYHSSTNRTTGVDIVQIDYTYNGSTISLYINGEPAVSSRTVSAAANAVDWTALGGRLSDISRQCHITYYNVMVYNKALDIEDIKHNFELNKRRYGEKKADSEPKTFVSSGGFSSIDLYKENEFNGSTGTPIQSASYSVEGFQENKLFRSAEWMVVEPKAGWEIFKIIENGVSIPLSSLSQPQGGALGSVYLEVKDPTNTERRYNVICIPTSNWYAAPEKINMHLDGRLNQGFRGENTSTAVNRLASTWKDISYNDNDGTLLNIPFAETVRVTDKGVNIPLATPSIEGISGWDGKGLKFDGWDDLVRFPGKINPSAYTISIYLCLEQNQLSVNPNNSTAIQYNWIVGTGTNNQNGFPGIVFGRNATPWRLRNNGHGRDADYSPHVTIPGTLGEDIIQIDYTFYSDNKIDVYVNGELKGSITGLTNTANPQSTVVLGNRTNDMIRAAHMTVYNMMIYNKSLSPTEIEHNYNVNKARYGTKKTD